MDLLGRETGGRRDSVKAMQAGSGGGLNLSHGREKSGVGGRTVELGLDVQADGSEWFWAIGKRLALGTEIQNMGKQLSRRQGQFRPVSVASRSAI